MTNTSGTAIARVDGLCFAHPQRPVFTHWSARIPPGVTLVHGDEGSGKTTLLGLLAGALQPDAGVLRIGGERLDQDAAAYRALVFRTEPQSALPQHDSMWDWLETVVYTRYPRADRAVVPGLVERLGLHEHRDKPLHMLSTGSRRKVWLLAAWASGAPLTLLDQPFAALDKASILAVRALLREAGTRADRAWVVADYEAPPDVALAHTIALD